MKTQRFSFLNSTARILLAAAFCGMVCRASAHEVWIEDTPDGKLFVRFAEYGEKLEKSPGALDALTLPFAWTPGVETKAEAQKADGASTGSKEERDIRAGKVQSFEVQKDSDGFLLSGAAASMSVQAETGFTVMGTSGIPEKPARKPFFYARWQPAGSVPATPALNFDLVPTGTAGKVCVYLRGKPLAGAKVKLYAPADADQELTSDGEGMIYFTAAKPGLYVLAAARQREVISGFFGGKAYDVVSHNCSLSWRQP
ncbi:MAG: SpaA isopeptide-forming pilin-related protein [Verrucomicrobiota bacterium]